MRAYISLMSHILISPICIPFLSKNIIFSLTSAAKLPWKPAGSFSQKYFNCSVLKDTASSTLTFLSLLILPKATRNSSGGWSIASDGFMHGSNLFNPIQDGDFWGCSRMVRGGGDKKAVTHVLQWWNLAPLYLT